MSPKAGVIRDCVRVTTPVQTHPTLFLWKPWPPGHVPHSLCELVILTTLVFTIFLPSCLASEAMPSVVANADVKCDCWSPGPSAVPPAGAAGECWNGSG